MKITATQKKILKAIAICDGQQIEWTGSFGHRKLRYRFRTYDDTMSGILDITERTLLALVYDGLLSGSTRGVIKLTALGESVVGDVTKIDNSLMYDDVFYSSPY